MSNTIRYYPTNKKKFCDYYHEFTYKEIDYDSAYDYYLENADVQAFGCSAFRYGRFFARNLDLPYSDQVEFMIRTPKTQNFYAVNGHSGGFSELTETFVSSGEESELYKILPFQLHDGKNETGLTACYNLVPNDYGNNVAEASVSEEVRICGLMLVRYILDRYSDAYLAAKYVKEHCTVYFPTLLHSNNYELHLMIADSHSTYILEFIDNKTEIIDVSDSPYMTNFHRYGTTLNSDGTVFTPETQTETEDAIVTNGITEYGSGLERFNIIAKAYKNDDFKNYPECRKVLDKLRFTRAYPTSPIAASRKWYTEFVGNDLKVNSPVEDYSQIMLDAGQAYLARDRSNPETWHTTHSVIYDILSDEIIVIPQESGLVFNPYFIPYKPDSRLEMYLGAIAGLYGFSKPEIPETPSERLLDYIFENFEKPSKPVVVHALENKTINGFVVPKLTDEQIIQIYNSIIVADNVVISDYNETMFFSGINADVVSDEIFISFRYFDKMILEYTEGNITNYKEL